jgi:hypothetical protein
MPRKDLNTAAFAIMQQATGEVVPEPIDEKKKAAQERSFDAYKDRRTLNTANIASIKSTVTRDVSNWTRAQRSPL